MDGIVIGKLKKTISDGKMRRYSVEVNHSMLYGVESIEVLEKISGTHVIFDRNDIEDACIDFFERSVLNGKLKEGQD